MMGYFVIGMIVCWLGLSYISYILYRKQDHDNVVAGDNSR